VAGKSKPGTTERKFMAIVTMSQLLEAGVHFGHQSSRWNPKMAPYILTKRNGMHIINLVKTVDAINQIYGQIRESVAQGGEVLFVGTKSQAREAIEMQATRVGMPYVSQRWLGGMLTNFDTVSKRVKRLQELEQMNFDDPSVHGLTKKEMLLLSRELNKLKTVLGGFQTMRRMPKALWVVDIIKERIAVEEAKRMNIKVFSIMDTNCNPDLVDAFIPGNDDATSSIGILTKLVADAVAQGVLDRSAIAEKSNEDGEDRPLAQWEKDLLNIQTLAPSVPPAPLTTAGSVSSDSENSAAASIESKVSDDESSPKPKVKPEPKSSGKPGIEVAAKVEPKVLDAESSPKAKVTVETEAKVQPKSEVKPKSKANADPKTSDSMTKKSLVSKTSTKGEKDE
jgi:small subunit ribosomal protein S2